MTKTALYTAVIISTGVAFLPAAACAENPTVENALKNRAELSRFYEGLVSTGVINELRSDIPYTIFAPRNDALAQLSPERYPCFYSVQCKAEAADILRNHIVPEIVTFTGPSKGAVFSIDGTHINLGKPHKGSYTVDGKPVVSQYLLPTAMLYTIDGVIAEPQELANISQMRVIPVAELPRGQVVETVTEKVYYGPDGRPDGVSQTTTITTKEGVLLAPAR